MCITDGKHAEFTARVVIFPVGSGWVGFKTETETAIFGEKRNRNLGSDGGLSRF